MCDYYSGTVALNLYRSENCGDWHSAIAIKSIESGISKSPFFVISEDGDFNAFKYFGNDGIVDYSKEIEKMSIRNIRGVTMVAKPYRAVADMILYSLVYNRSFDFIEVDSWIPDADELKNVFRLLDSTKFLNDHQKERVAVLKSKYGIK